MKEEIFISKKVSILLWIVRLILNSFAVFLLWLSFHVTSGLIDSISIILLGVAVTMVSHCLKPAKQSHGIDKKIVD